MFVYARPNPMTLAGFGRDVSNRVNQVLEAQKEIEE
jgi:hypothetical protein